MGTRGTTASKFALFLAVCLFLLWPAHSQKSSDTANGTNTSFSKHKNLTKLKEDSCEWSVIRPKYSIIAAIVSGLLVLEGCLLCSMGYKRQRTSYSLLGFTIAGLVGYAIVEYKFHYSLGIQLLITGSIALFVSILCSSVLYCGIFLTGLGTGFCLGSVVIVIISEVHKFGSFAEPILILIGLGIVFASVSLWWKRTFIILGTSVIGGSFVMGGIDYFVEGFLFLENIQHIIYGQKYRRLCYFSWIVFALFPVIAITGLLIQHLKTSRIQKRPKSLSNQELAMNRLSGTSHQSRV